MDETEKQALLVYIATNATTESYAPRSVIIGEGKVACCDEITCLRPHSINNYTNENLTFALCM